MTAREWTRRWYSAGGKVRCGSRGLVLLQGRNPIEMVGAAAPFLPDLRRMFAAA